MVPDGPGSRETLDCPARGPAAPGTHLSAPEIASGACLQPAGEEFSNLAARRTDLHVDVGSAGCEHAVHFIH